jgi:uncharacterized protein
VIAITDSHDLHATPAEVWAALADPEVVRHALPGCRSLAVTGPGEAQVTVQINVGNVRGVYQADVAARDADPPQGVTITVAAEGGPGTVETTARVVLAPNPAGGTRLTYEAQVTPAGMLAGLGQRLLSSVIRNLAHAFLSAVDTDLTRRRAGAAVPAEAAPAPADPRVEAPVEAPVEVPVDVTPETPGEAPPETLGETPLATQVEAPPETPADPLAAVASDPPPVATPTVAGSARWGLALAAMIVGPLIGLALFDDAGRVLLAAAGGLLLGLVALLPRARTD